MTVYRLVDGKPFKKIMKGKQWVGRVGTHADGSFVGTIGNMTIKSTTEKRAFEEIVARALGYANGSSFKTATRYCNRHANRQATRQTNRVQATQALDTIFRGDFKPLGELRGKL